MAGAKTTPYAENGVALAYAKERGCTEAIFANTVGMLCEGTGSNVFCVFDGHIITPPLSSGCLAGVTRELVPEITDALEEDIAMRDRNSVVKGKSVSVRVYHGGIRTISKKIHVRQSLNYTQ